MRKIISLLCIVAIVFGTCISVSAYTWSYNSNGKTIREDDSSVSSVRDTIYNYLDENTDLNKAAICGILGNIWAECCFNVKETYGSYNGLCQWGGSRWTNCQSFCKKNGYSIKSAKGQTAFMVYELKNDYPSTYKKLLNVSNDEDGVYDAEAIFRKNYEGCGNQAKARRQAAAITFWKNINTKSLNVETTTKKADTKTTVEEPVPNTGDNSEAIETVFKAIEKILKQYATSVK